LEQVTKVTFMFNIFVIRQTSHTISQY